jgi:hypothetical protein
VSTEVHVIAGDRIKQGLPVLKFLLLPNFEEYYIYRSENYLWICGIIIDHEV